MSIPLNNLFLLISILSTIFLFQIVSSNKSGIIINVNDIETKKLNRFWTNTGFSTPAPINKTTEFLLSNDVRLNLQMIGSLPNADHVRWTVRTHWILELIRIKNFTNDNLPIYDFKLLNEYISHLINANLKPSIEFMGNPSGYFKSNTNSVLWKNLVEQFMNNLLTRYDKKTLKEWNFETWNEPDLKTYNTLNFTIEDFMNYIHSISDILHLHDIKVRGPAGLFKRIEKHPFCWNVLNECNNSNKNCSIDILTYHRKGNGSSAVEIVNGGIELIELIYNKFPNLKNIPISNDEADPISGWSKPYSFHSDIRYAAITVANVLLHWNAKLNNKLKNLESISHDNAFLSYHPYEFDQRTLLARFQMNLTKPPHVQFIQKPVYAALGMLGNLGEMATRVHEFHLVSGEKIIYLTTKNRKGTPFYSCIILTLSNEFLETQNKYSIFNLTIIGLNTVNNESLVYFIEKLEKDFNDPVSLWRWYGSPPYPNTKVRKEMRKIQVPGIADGPTNINGSTLNLQFSLRNPWIAVIRICSSLVDVSRPPTHIHFHRINKNEVMIFWRHAQKSFNCIKTYEIYFKSIEYNSKWKHITKKVHVPFLSYQKRMGRNKTISGYYRIRSRDFFNRPGQFSRERLYVS